MRAWRGIAGTFLALGAVGSAGATAYGVLTPGLNEKRLVGTFLCTLVLSIASLVMLNFSED